MLELGFSLLPGEFDVVADCDGSCVLDGGGGGPCLLHSGLCCPDDQLDQVIIEITCEELLEDIAIAASLPPRRVLLLPTAGRGKQHAVVDVDSEFTIGRRGYRGGVCSGGAPVHAALSSDNSSRTWTSTSSSLKAEPSSPSRPPPPSPVSQSQLAVPRRKRDRSVMRGRRLWSVDMPTSIPTAARGNPSSSGGGARRAPVPRSRNRQVPRACSHCDNTETPQWRTGPDGPGTLCNACGIRHKMKRLLPEYRPSTSPSFQSQKHSNRHRKVVMLREKKEEDTVVVMLRETKEEDTVVGMPPAPDDDDGGEFMDVL